MENVKNKPEAKFQFEKFHIGQDLFVEKKWDEIEERIRDGGTVEIVPINKKKFEFFSFRSYQGKDGLTYGVPTRKNIDGTYEFKRITITGHQTYNMSNKHEAMEALVIMNNSRCKKSPNSNGKPLFEVLDRDAQANNTIQRLAHSRDAIDIALKMNDEDMVDFSRVIGITPESNSMSIVRQLVCEKASKSPDYFMEMYTHANRGVLQVLHRAKACNIVKYTPEGGYTYKDGYPLGVTEQDVISTLLSNKRVLNSMNAESRNLSPLSKNLAPGEHEDVAEAVERQRKERLERDPKEEVLDDSIENGAPDNEPGGIQKGGDSNEEKPNIEETSRENGSEDDKTSQVSDQMNIE